MSSVSRTLCHFERCEIQPTCPVPPLLACSGGLRSVKNTVLKIGIEALGSGRDRHGRIPGAGTPELRFPPTPYTAVTCERKAKRSQHKDTEEEDKEKEGVPVATGAVWLTESPVCSSLSSGTPFPENGGSISTRNSKTLSLL